MLKIIFKNLKNIILMYFKIKNILKSNYHHTFKQTFKNGSWKKLKREVGLGRGKIIEKKLPQEHGKTCPHK